MRKVKPGRQFAPVNKHVMFGIICHIRAALQTKLRSSSATVLHTQSAPSPWSSASTSDRSHTEWQPGWTPAPCKDLHQPPARKPRKTQQLFITDDTALITAYHTHSLTVGGSDTRGPQLCTDGLNKLWNIYYLNEKQVFSQHPRPGTERGSWCALEISSVWTHLPSSSPMS